MLRTLAVLLCLGHAGAKEPRRVLLDQEGPARMERIGETLVMRLAGTPGEMGFQHGAMARQAVRTILPTLDPAGAEPNGAEPRDLEELEGMAKGMRSSVERVLALQRLAASGGYDGEEVVVVRTNGNGERSAVTTRLGVFGGSPYREQPPWLFEPPPKTLLVDNGWRAGREPEVLGAVSGVVPGFECKRPAARNEEEKKLLAEFVASSAEFPWLCEVVEREEAWVVSEVRFPSAFDSGWLHNDVVRGRWFRAPEVEEPRPAFILLHHLENRFLLEEQIARHLTRQGVDVFLMYMPYYGPRQPPRGSRNRLVFGVGKEGPRRFVQQTHADILRARAWIRSLPNVSRVGLGGISLGGILSSLVGGVEADFDRLVPMLAGGDLATMLKQEASESRSIRRQLEQVGITLDEISRIWAIVEPNRFAGRVDPKTVLMVNADKDDVISRASTLSLWEAFGKPEIRWFPGTHTTVIFRVGPMLDAVTAHLREE